MVLARGLMKTTNALTTVSDARLEKKVTVSTAGKVVSNTDFIRPQIVL